MLNSTHIQRKLEQSPRIQELLAAGKKPRQLVEGLYLTILSRFPTDEEAKIALRHLDAGKKARREAVIDFAWALVNSAEFMYRH